MNEEYIRHMIVALTPNCHEGERDELIKWVLENLEERIPRKEYRRDSI